jgi:hypothetical protein
MDHLPCLRGEGTCVNPNIDANGLTAEDFAEDPDFAEDYFGGVYDVRCAACGGSGKIKQSHMATLRQHAADRRLAAMEDGDWEGVSYASDYRFG